MSYQDTRNSFRSLNREYSSRNHNYLNYQPNSRQFLQSEYGTKKYQEPVKEDYQDVNKKIDKIFDFMKVIESRLNNFEDLFIKKLQSLEEMLEKNTKDTHKCLSLLAQNEERISNFIQLPHQGANMNNYKHEECIQNLSLQISELLSKLSDYPRDINREYGNPALVDITNLTVNSRSQDKSDHNRRDVVPEPVRSSSQTRASPNVRRNQSSTHSRGVRPENILPSRPTAPVRDNRKALTPVLSPKGLENPSGFCYLNCVIQLLRSCQEFNTETVKYHQSSAIVSSTADDNEKRFLNDFCKLIIDMNNRKDLRIRDGILRIQSYFDNASSGDDIMQSFMKVLSKMHNVINIKNAFERTGTISGMSADEAFSTYQRRNKGFVFDSFYGQISDKVFCKTCRKTLRETFQLFKTIGLPVPNDERDIELTRCIDSYFEPSKLDQERTSDKVKNCLCSNPERTKLYTVTKITHSPKYLFLYLNRGSYYVNGTKNNSFVHSGMILHLPTDSGECVYELLSVVDHIGDNDGGHYYVKSNFEKSQWYIINDGHVQRMPDGRSIVSKNAIAFIFKKLS